MQTVAQLLALSLALAFSTVPILAALLILLSPNRSRSAIPFLIGWMLGMFGIAALLTMAAQFVPASRLPRREDEAVGMLEIVVGAGLILLGLITLWLSRMRTEHRLPAWLKSVEKLGPWSSFGLAVVLNLRPKSLLVAAAAGLALRADASSTAEAVVALAVYTVVGASTVAVPIIATIATPTRMEPRIIATRDWLTRNGQVLTSAIVIVIGVLVVAVGIGRL